jgi:hypothetical protein
MWVIDSEHKSAIEISNFWLADLKLETGDEVLVEIRALKAQRLEEVQTPILLAVKVFPLETYFRFIKEWINKVNESLRINTIVDFQAICENFNN